MTDALIRTNAFGEPCVAEFDERTWTQSEIDLELAILRTQRKRDLFLAKVRRHRVFDDGWREQTRTRGDTNLFNDVKKKLVLGELKRHGNLTLAADAAGFSVITVRKHMEKDVDFSQAVADRLGVYAAEVSSDLVRSALEGHLERKMELDNEGKPFVAHERRVFETKIRERILVRNDPSYKEQKEVANTFSGGVVLLPSVSTPEAWGVHYEKLRAAQREKALAEQRADGLLPPGETDAASVEPRTPIDTTGEEA